MRIDHIVCDRCKMAKRTEDCDWERLTHRDKRVTAQMPIGRNLDYCGNCWRDVVRPALGLPDPYASAKAMASGFRG